MTMTIHDRIIPAYVHGLSALSGQLDKALAWGTQNSVGELQFIASRLVKEIGMLGGDVRPFLSESVADLLLAKIAVSQG